MMSSLVIMATAFMSQMNVMATMTAETIVMNTITVTVGRAIIFVLIIKCPYLENIYMLTS